MSLILLLNIDLFFSTLSDYQEAKLVAIIYVLSLGTTIGQTLWNVNAKMADALQYITRLARLLSNELPEPF
jgi:hypothetical protein